ncbi:hypothetical protein [Arthrobacter sp. ISL-30]|uniref:hypothetical protein n=1 Tax=Arthrobacter sp. ISL-30 TaxID=2819109 RepID=UPI001BED2B0A|nr:hypothetical protein [Arthrobacter sp. ISL-30]MBT2513437.1 hypothetical protein [Arthrobacter sp. ISL-30]
MIDSAVAILHDGTTIQVAVQGDGPALLVPARLDQYAPEEAETMRQWGGDPDLGPNLVNGLSRSNRVIAADYEGHRMAHPAPDTLTPENVAADFLAIADYEALQDFDDFAASIPRDLPKLVFAGADDRIDYGQRWGDVQVKIGESLATHKDALIESGWDVEVLPGLDHLGAMQSSVVLPILTGWLPKVGWVK